MTELGETPWQSPLPVALRITATVLLVVAGYVVAARIGGVFPFEREEALAPEVAIAALPEDFPVPERGEVEFAGRGDELPYRVVWLSEASFADTVAVYEDLLRSGDWELMLEEETSPAFRIRLARTGPEGDMTHWAMLDVEPAGEQTRITLEFIVTGGGSIDLR